MLTIYFQTLPYGSVNCNSKHYMEYIVWAIPRQKKKVKDCPLYREIHEVDLRGIANDEKLYLMDRRNRTIYVKDLPHRDYSYTPNFDREREIINRKAKDAPSSSGVKKDSYAGSVHN
ncbi:unnamed protein product [Bemisia tabaci]|uniref:Uncharacterized protein n=1 Tax=Bemisia tabaci TaxID=7038 RepID=A0A9P0AQM6_BEMTA|nr:unnamed protein product [Bemisia tabaci]